MEGLQYAQLARSSVFVALSVSLQEVLNPLCSRQMLGEHFAVEQRDPEHAYPGFINFDITAT